MQRSLILLFFLFVFQAESQLKSEFILEGDRHDQRIFRDTLALSQYALKLQYQFVKKGFFFSGIDSVVSQKGEVLIYMHLGEKADANVYLERKKLKNPIREISKTIKEYSNSGYPFVQVSLDSTSFDGRTLEGKLKINEGPEIVYDSAFFFNPLKTNKSFVFMLLDVEPQSLFNETSYRSIEEKLSRSSFLKLKREVDISFTKGKAKVFLDLQEDKTNTFQGVLGIQQGLESQTVAVGSLDLSIDNLFSSGKELDFFWERYDENSQRLNLFYKHPFFLDSKISPSFTFDLLKQDTTFLTRVTGLGVSTFIAPKIELLIQFNKSVGTLLSNDQEQIAKTGVADYEKNIYRIELREGFFEKLNTYGKGIAWKMNIGSGRKKINENLNFQPSFYDTIRLETNFFELNARMIYQVSVRKRQAFFHDLSVGQIENSELLTNELYRLGGLSSLRGFNEKLFFAERYFSSRMEFRSFFEENSYLYFFYDQLFYGRNQNMENPFGFGFGFAIDTSSGQFNFALAAGKSKTQNIDFSGIKVHFGYMSRF